MSPSHSLGPPSLEALDTPALVLDIRRLDSNLARMRQRVGELGVALRPHMKTAKSVDIARRVLQAGEGIAVSTLAEAEYFADHGIRNILYAVAMAPQKLPRVARLIRAGTQLRITVDHPVAAAAVRDASAEMGVTFEVMIEIDSGQGRSGVAGDSGALLEIAQTLTPGAAVVGVMTHGGHSYGGRSPADHAAVAEQERAAATTAAETLRAAGFACPVVSVGSTPSVSFARGLAGVTEVRAGVYMLGDLFQAGLGVCTRSDIAVSVLATVIGQRPERNQLVVDAGSLALSKDISTRSLGTEEDCGYGLVVSAVEGELIAGLYVESLHQEHGVVRGREPIDFSRFPIGARVRILPNHACLTAAAHDRYHVVGEGATIEAVWNRTGGW